MQKDKFVPKKDQIDYSHARWAPVVNCVVRSGKKILIVKRSGKLRYFPGYWNGISGYLDDQLSLREKVEEELAEEIGIKSSGIARITSGPIFDFESKEYGKIWITHPILVDLKKGSIKLNWEASEYRWVLPERAFSFKLVPGFHQVLVNLWQWLAEA